MIGTVEGVPAISTSHAGASVRTFVLSMAEPGVAPEFAWSGPGSTQSSRWSLTSTGVPSTGSVVPGSSGDAIGAGAATDGPLAHPATTTAAPTLAPGPPTLLRPPDRTRPPRDMTRTLVARAHLPEGWDQIAVVMTVVIWAAVSARL